MHLDNCYSFSLLLSISFTTGDFPLHLLFRSVSHFPFSSFEVFGSVIWNGKLHSSSVSKEDLHPLSSDRIDFRHWLRFNGFFRNKFRTGQWFRFLIDGLIHLCSADRFFIPLCAAQELNAHLCGEIEQSPNHYKTSIRLKFRKEEEQPETHVTTNSFVRFLLVQVAVTGCSIFVQDRLT
nr:hypothetical transcript [Hymenolepis microstoma]